MTVRLCIAIAAAFSPIPSIAAAAEASTGGPLLAAGLAETDAPVSKEEDDTRAPTPMESHSASSETSTSASRDWDASVITYLWLSSVHANIGIPRRNNDVRVHRSFADILGNLKFAFMGALDVRYKRLVMLGDTVYLNIGTSAKPKRPELGFLTAKADTKIFLGTIGGGYRVVDGGPLYVDLLAGGRLVSLNVDLELTGPLQTRSASVSPSQLSPIIGARARLPLSEKWAVAVYGDVGISSDVKWQAIATVQRELGRHWELGAGWRYLHISHDRADAGIKLNFSGPIAAVRYKF